MYHRHRSPRGGGDHIDLRIHPGERAFQHRHGKHAGARRNIARAHAHAVGGGHARARVPLRRAQRHTGAQHAGGIQQTRALRCQRARVRAGAKHPGQNIRKAVRHTFLRQKRVKCFFHSRVVTACRAVNGEHARRFAHAQHPFPRQPPVHIARQRGQVCNVPRMGLAVQYRLVQMRNAPPLWNVERKPLRQQRRGAFCCRVAPGAEGCKLRAVPRKGQVSVHHTGNTHCAHGMQRRAVPLLNLPGQPGKCILHARPYVIQGIGPVSVLQTVFPIVRTAGQHSMLRPNEHRFDARRAKLQPQRCFFKLYFRHESPSSHLRQFQSNGRDARWRIPAVVFLYRHPGSPAAKQTRKYYTNGFSPGYGRLLG